MRRLFIAINLPENIKRQIENFVSQIEIDADVRWLPPENWHLTITFLGHQPDEAMQNILKPIKETVLLRGLGQKLKIEFDKIILAPPDKSPRMIWLVGTKETSRALAEIKNKLDALLRENGVDFKNDYKTYNSHITLARFQNLSNYKIPDSLINQLAIRPINFTVQSLDLMESHLKRAGAEYEVLAKVDFSK
jgi:2'-5' RNA ligase